MSMGRKTNSTRLTASQPSFSGPRKTTCEPGSRRRLDDPFGRAGSSGLIGLNLLNVLAVLAESVASIRASYGGLLRVWSCPVDPRYRHPLTGRVRFAPPAGIVGSAFIELREQQKAEHQEVCPHCGKQLSDLHER